MGSRGNEVKRAAVKPSVVVGYAVEIKVQREMEVQRLRVAMEFGVCGMQRAAIEREKGESRRRLCKMMERVVEEMAKLANKSNNDENTAKNEQNR